MLRDVLEVLDGSLDLLLGGACVGCTHPGRVLCDACRAGLPRAPRPAWPSPSPPGLAPPWAAGEYDGPIRAMVLAHKEHRVLALRAPLAHLLALTVRSALSELPAGPVVLVPVPSRPGTARSRGHDPTWSITTRAARLVRAAGSDAAAMRMLRSRPGVLDQAGLDSGARAANLAGSMHCPTAALRRLGTLRPRARIVVCDDVLTTGSTAREAQRALESVGLDVVAVAAVAATRRRVPGRSGAARPAPDPTWDLGPF